MQKYSIFSLIKNAFSNHQNWEVAWKDPEPKKEYDVIIIGGGGHGLATAYYLAKEHNITKVAIIEKGWIGGGNVGRNTTIIRSYYMHDENALFSEFGMDLWRKMSQDLKIAKAYVLPLGGKDADKTIEKLKEYSFLIRKILSQKIIAKFLPKILFRKDESFEYAEKIENLIKQTNK